MKISYSWLRNYIDTDMSAEEMSTALTAIGLEVESLETEETVKGGLEGVVVGKVITCEKHPDADKLKITTVDYGEGPVQIVCGAPNVAAGQKVVVATVGCTLYPNPDEPFKIKKSKIRGAESLGMLCAEDELGLGVSHDGIIVLDDSAEIGTPAKKQFVIEEEYIFEIGLTPNRIDAASHTGVARDLAAYLRYNGQDVSVKYAPVDAFKVDNHNRETKVTVKDGDACPHYMGLTMTGVKVGPSPEWLQKRLRSIGLNPHNNVVDVTNFILHELGQPMHAFDADKITGGEVIVKKASEGEKFVTLDGVERTLSAEDLMICNTEAPMCIAGVLGGAESGVTENTTNVFLESAYFNPVSVRRSAKRHGINTDASFRYERGTDPNILGYALRRAALLIQETGGGEVSSEIMDVLSHDIKPFRVELSIDKTERLIGKKIGGDTIRKILSALDIEIVEDDGDRLVLSVPPYRVDVQRAADVTEDILRIYGYNNIEILNKVNSTIAYAPNPDREKIKNTASDLLSSNGFNEIMSNSLTKSAYYEGCDEFPEDRCVRILNPLSNDLNVMRQTLLFNMLEAIVLNSNRKNGDLKFYEYGNVYTFSLKAHEEGKGLNAYRESPHMALAMTGKLSAPSWNEKPEEASFYALKAMCEKLLRRFGLNINEAVYETHESELYSTAVDIRMRGKRLMTIGSISKKTRKQFDIKAEVYYADIDFDAFVNMVKTYSLTVKELSKYPEVSRDLSMLLDNKVTFSDLRNVAFKTEKNLLKNVTLFDVYEGDKLPEGKKSYALNFILEDTTQTLTDNVIDRVMNNLATQFEKQLGAEIRK